ncbi:MAG: hypothetical protein AAB575_00370 [Patescibacteria group bacterium]
MEGQLIRMDQVRLPQLPIKMRPLEGENLDHEALILDSGATSVDQANVQFRMKHAPEAQPYFRRYYLRPIIVGGNAIGKYSIHYVWNFKRPKSDRMIGVIEGEDLAAARMLIGNGVAGYYMTPIRWEISEDRDGEEPIAMGRFDPWSLLQDVSPGDVTRLFGKDIIPNIEAWDFDRMYFERVCPACGTKVTINMCAFSIDSAKCAKCGIRPFLSRSLGRLLQMALPSVTGKNEEKMIETDEALTHAISWLGGVNASAHELHQEELPEGFTPHRILRELLKQSRLLAPHEGGGLTLSSSVKEKFLAQAGGATLINTTVGIANTLVGVIESGGPFTPVHQAMAGVLRAIDNDHLANQ